MKAEYNNQLLGKYKAALLRDFTVDKMALDRDELKAYLETLEERKAMVLRSRALGGEAGHVMFLVKDEGRYYFYDPNEGIDNEILSGPGFSESRSLDEIVDQVYNYYGGSLKEIGYPDKKEYWFETVDVSLAMKLSSKGLSLLDDIEMEESSLYPEVDGQKRQVKSLRQDPVVGLVTSYFNTVYKPRFPVVPGGVCYGLSLVLRELLVQTGSIERSSEILYIGLNKLNECVKKYDIKMRDRELRDEVIEELGSNHLLLSLIPFYHSMQTFAINEKYLGDMSDEHKDSEMDATSHTAWPLSIMMETGGSETFYPSNPMVVYSAARDLSDVELLEMEKEIVSDKRGIFDPTKELMKNFAYLSFLKWDSPEDKKRLLKLIHTFQISVLKYLPPVLRQDKAFVLEAAKLSPYIADVMDPALRYDKEIMMTILKNDMSKVKFMNDLSILSEEDWKVLVESGTMRGHYDIPAGVIKDRAILMGFLREKTASFKNKFFDAYRGDRDFILEAMQYNKEVVNHISKDLLEDQDFVFKIITIQKGYMRDLYYSDSKLIDDPSFVLRVIDLDPELFRYASNRIRQDAAFVLDLVAQRKYRACLQYAGSDFFSNDGSDLLSNKEFISRVVDIDSALFEYANDDIKRDKAYVLPLLEKDIGILHYLTELRSDAEFMSEAIRINRLAFLYANPELKASLDFIIQAVVIDEKVLEYVSADLLEDVNFAVSLVSANENAMIYIPDEVKSSLSFRMKLGYRSTVKGLFTLGRQPEPVRPTASEDLEEFVVISPNISGEDKSGDGIDLDRRYRR